MKNSKKNLENYPRNPRMLVMLWLMIAELLNWDISSAFGKFTVDYLRNLTYWRKTTTEKTLKKSTKKC
jgi:hypothetical protein